MRLRISELQQSRAWPASKWITIGLVACAGICTGCTSKSRIEDPAEAFIWLQPGDEIVIYEKDGSTTEMVVSAVNLAELRGDATRIGGSPIESRPVAISLSEIASIDRVEDLVSPENKRQLIGGVGVHMIFFLIGALVVALVL